VGVVWAYPSLLTWSHVDSGMHVGVSVLCGVVVLFRLCVDAPVPSAHGSKLHVAALGTLGISTRVLFPHG